MAPKRCAARSFPSLRSTATISAAPAIRAPWITLTPTPPQPITSTLLPGVMAAVFRAAPTPVITPQPSSEATSSGTSSGILIAEVAGATVCSQNVGNAPTPADSG